MSGRGILDADMRTLVLWAGEGWRWWTAELAGLMPARLRGLGTKRWPRLHYHGGVLSPESGKALPAAGARVSIVLAEGQFLVRRIERPAVNDTDLRKMLAMEGDRLLPFAGEGAIVAGRVIGKARAAGRATVAVGGISTATAREIADAIAVSGYAVAQILAESSDAPGIDFAPVMRDAGILAPHRSARSYLWILVGFLVSLNMAAVVWRDIASVERLERLVQEQEPAVAIAQKIGQRVEAALAIAFRTANLRERHDALGTLATVSEALPQGTWVVRYVWDGPSVRLSGYRPANTDVATALRSTNRFTEVQSGADDLQAALPTGEPFDITARVGGQ